MSLETFSVAVDHTHDTCDIICSLWVIIVSVYTTLFYHSDKKYKTILLTKSVSGLLTSKNVSEEKDDIEEEANILTRTNIIFIDIIIDKKNHFRSLYRKTTTKLYAQIQVQILCTNTWSWHNKETKHKKNIITFKNVYTHSKKMKVNFFNT